MALTTDFLCKACKALHVQGRVGVVIGVQEASRMRLASSPHQNFVQFCRDFMSTGGRARTDTVLTHHRILSPARLPIPPLRHTLEGGDYSMGHDPPRAAASSRRVKILTLPPPRGCAGARRSARHIPARSSHLTGRMGQKLHESVLLRYYPGTICAAPAFNRTTR
jgi:hypothetical protein